MANDTNPVKKVELENAVFEGRNNVYLLDGESPVLIDTGIAGGGRQTQLQAKIARYGIDIAAIEKIFVTHFHPDHSGLAGEIQDESGADVHVHEADAPLVDRSNHAWEKFAEQRTTRFEEWGVPREKIREFSLYLDNEGDFYGSHVNVDPVQDGEQFQVGDSTLEVKHLPGHTAGHSCFVLGSELFAGDALLPYYTPNVGGADVRLENPLELYIESLREIQDSDYTRALPGHRTEISSPSERASKIIYHHECRSEETLDVLTTEGPMTPWQMSRELFGDVTGVHILHGPGEAYAHLEHLRKHGLVEESSNRYHLLCSATNVPELVEELF